MRNPFTPVEDAFLRQLFAAGLPPSSIARKMDRPDSSIYRRLQFLGLREGTTAKSERLCMCCRKKFMSDGPHNRLCSRCRNQSTTPFHF